MSKRLTVVAGVVVLAILVVAGRTAVAQGGTESQLQARIAQNAQDLEAYLDLVKIYARAGRFDDAERALGLAQGLIVSQRQSAAKLVGLKIQTDEPVRVGGPVAMPVKINDVKPVYPEMAKSAKIAGNVYLEIVIDTAGRVVDAKVVGGPALLQQAALDAIKQWQYAPPVVDGRPATLVMNVTIVFKLPS